MKISIVTPSFNQDKYIATCIRSVLMQTYTNVEHIIIDGLSTDHTINIIEEFKRQDNRLTYISEKDGGQGDAVNKGFEIARGDIVGWLNSDDFYYDTNVFSYVVDFFEKNPKIDMIYGGMVYVNGNDEITNIRIPPDFDYRCLQMISYIGNTNAFFRRSVIERHKLDPQYHFVIDHEFMLRVTREFCAQRTKKLFCCFRVHDEAKTQTLSKVKKDAERARRNKVHNITEDLNFRVRQLYERALYKISLIRSNFIMLNYCKKKKPFAKFLS